MPYPEFHLRLPHSGPMAHGRLLDEKGTNGSRKFLVSKGSPARQDVVPSFPTRMPSSHNLRQSLINAGRIAASRAWPGYLETTEDIICNSPSAAAEILVGRSANGWTVWKASDGRPLGDFLEVPVYGSNRTWLVRGSHVSGVDLVQRLWLPEDCVSLPATHLRDGVQQGMSKDQLRTCVEMDYESTLTYNQRLRLVDELHAFLSRMKPGDTVCAYSNGLLYVGEITGDLTQILSDAGRSNLRRPVEWASVGYPYDDLPEALQQKLSIQHDVIDLTPVSGLVAGLGRTDEELADEADDVDGSAAPASSRIASARSRSRGRR